MAEVESHNANRACDLCPEPSHSIKIQVTREAAGIKFRGLELTCGQK